MPMKLSVCARKSQSSRDRAKARLVAWYQKTFPRGNNPRNPGFTIPLDISKALQLDSPHLERIGSEIRTRRGQTVVRL